MFRYSRYWARYLHIQPTGRWLLWATSNPVEWNKMNFKWYWKEMKFEKIQKKKKYRIEKVGMLHVVVSFAKSHRPASCNDKAPFVVRTFRNALWNSKAGHSASLTYNPQAYHEDHKHGTGTNGHKPGSGRERAIRTKQIRLENSKHLRFKYKSGIKINSI